MRSYYAENHEGYCIEFSQDSIINSIIDLDINGICIYGNVLYKDKRPDTNSKLLNFSYSAIHEYVDVVFSKFKEWSHEDEYRFIMISDKIINDYIPINGKITNFYGGCQNKLSQINDSAGNAISVKKLNKDDINYKLY